ncbi:phage tail protein [Hahella sp. CCB-MM4]|uniref:phage tail sheath subtilisin-like domain-containing protein n=1 Tax=Hahella sp. (strain CCB-MM4) TaxID=1926491 RepID=UPI000B9B5321|nr:phage tail sheath subtilisin-like domain-containing protein [Hahella sp. CCB-MM4]OZG70304.1 phage tail protein [Hahella sp. CCB-MM4]
MPEYLAPGVYVEEVSFRSKSIEGVGTSVAGMVGPTRFGPIRGRPEVVTSFNEFRRMFGDVEDLTFGGTDQLNYTAMAAKAFFDEGGKQLFVSRATNYASPTAGYGSATDSNNDVTFQARFPGSMGNFTLEVEWQDSENLLLSVATSAPAEGDIVYLDATGLNAEAIAADGLDGARFPMDIRCIAQRVGTHFQILNNLAQIDANDGTEMAATDLADSGNHLVLAEMTIGGATVSYTRVTAKNPTSGALTDGTAAVLTLSEETDLSDFHVGDHWGTLTTLYGTLNAAGTIFTVDGSGLNQGVGTAIPLYLSALGAAPSSVRAVMAQRMFSLSVHNGGKDAPVIYNYGPINTGHTGKGTLADVINPTPEKRLDQLTSPIGVEFDASISAGDVLLALYDMFDSSAMSPVDPLDLDGPRYLITMTGGNDGSAPVAIHYAGVTDEVSGSTGFAALEDIEDVSIVAVPAAAADSTNHQAIVTEMRKHCRKMRYRVGIVDARKGMALSEARNFGALFDDSRLAMYYPWVEVSDPRGKVNSIALPPSGFIAGVYANTDVQRGVHKPPANEPIYSALRFAQDINRFQQELLNPAGINCLRTLTSGGNRVWGGRTLSTDPEWKYVNVRRYFLYLERSIEKSTQWVVFEPNNERLWDNVRLTIESFLYNEWANGRLLGTDKTAYFVRCDRSTMTQNDIDNGRLVCEIGVAAVKPAEFVIFRIGQKTADSNG